MTSWKNNNTLREYLVEDSEKPGYAVNHWDTTWAEDYPLEVKANNLKYSLNSEYEFIKELLEDSPLEVYDDSDDDFNVLAVTKKKSTFRFYFNDKNELVKVTEMLNDSKATKEDPDALITAIKDFDIVETKRGIIFRILDVDDEGNAFAVSSIPLY